ncbi:putative protein kinase RLK-Pelle-CrRLK1L-1 family [Helianthus debilis subsp. tardiflorus]
MDTTNEEGENSSSPTSAHPFRLFSLAEIQYATKNFDDELVIGQGGFGKVFKGYISSEEVVAIKRLDSMSDQGEPEFRAEIDMLSKLRHCHLVSLIGYCHENNEKILVYEYMSNGTLYHQLHKADTPLTWLTRLNIAIGAARGLAYLHTSRVIHRDVKSSNILLDENWAAMISDFGLSKIGPDNQPISCVNASVKGTFGYLDPEYFYTRKLTRKSDVYSYGIVLFELLSGRLAVDERNEEDECSLVRWAQRCVKERKLDQIVDSNIKGTISAKCLKRFAQIADRCVHNDPKERPSMTEVVASLQALSVLQEKSNIELSATTSFSWIVPKYLVYAINPNFDQSGTVIRGINKFRFDELKLDTWLGKGRYGMVYKGWVDKTEMPIAVKILHQKKPSNLETLKEFVHPNLVKLVGYSFQGERLCLLYEFMHKGNLGDLLRSGAVARLPLVTKVKIVVGIARGIVFLQKIPSQKRWSRVGESWLDRRKILLDEDFTAKLSDYDVSTLVDAENNIAYLDIYGALELKSNLSGYEVVFVEVLTGERIYSSNRLEKIDRLFCQCGNGSLQHIAQLCFEICNEVDSESKMVTMLNEHDVLIRNRLKLWLRNTHS